MAKDGVPFEPGAARYGNFISYYSFHSPETRTKLLPIDILLDSINDQTSERPCLLLDIGCNTGELTEKLHSLISERKDCETLAVDIDEILIERAKEKNKQQSITYKCIDVAQKDEFLSSIKNYLSEKGQNKFDITFMFSVTMWVHLNFGDEGLLSVLDYVSRSSELIVIEPQPWKCYRSAIRRMKRTKNESFPFAKSNKIQGEGIENIIDQFVIEKCCFNKIYESKSTPWGRKIFIYKRIL